MVRSTPAAPGESIVTADSVAAIPNMGEGKQGAGAGKASFEAEACEDNYVELNVALNGSQQAAYCLRVVGPQGERQASAGLQDDAGATEVASCSSYRQSISKSSDVIKQRRHVPRTQIVGRLCFQGRASSSCAARRKSVASSPKRPMN